MHTYEKFVTHASLSSISRGDNACLFVVKFQLDLYTTKKQQNLTVFGRPDQKVTSKDFIF